MVGADGRIVGRAGELRALTAILDRGRSKLAAVVVEGEAGIGKTTLLDEVARIGRERAFTVLACRPAQSEAALSFGVLADLVDGVERHVLRQLPLPLRRAIDAVRLHADPTGTDLRPRAVGTALRSVLHGMAAHRPVLVVVDDAQWLDRPSEQALRFALRRLGDEPVAVVASVRTGGDLVDPLGLDTAVAGGVERVAVGGMSIAALRELLAERLGVVAARPVLVRLAEATGGNPFYVLELARALAHTGHLDDPTVDLPLPDRLHDLVADRIDSLGPAARRACLVVAELARPTVDLLLAATSSPTWVASGAAAAEDAGILTVDRDRLAFTHPLLRSAVYDDARPSERRDVHARLADVVDDDEERARHLAASAPGADAAVAAALDAGARQAWRRGARDAAAELAERALASTPRHDGINRRRLAAAAFQHEASNPTRSRALLQEVLEDHPTRAERLEATCHLGSIRYYADRFDLSRHLLESALAELHHDEHRLRARLETELTYTLVFSGDSRAALHHGEVALTAARAAQDGDLERAAAAPLALASLWAGDGARADMVELCLDGADPTEPFAIDPQVQAAAVLKWTDQLPRARAVLAARYELAQAQGAVAKLPILAWQIGDLELLAGRWDVAETLAEEALEGARFREGMALAMCAGLRSRVHAVRGRLDAARADADEAMVAGRACGGVALWAAIEATALVATCGGGAEAVHAVTGGFAADVSQLPPTDPSFLRWVPDEVEALVALGDVTTATTLLDWFEDRCRRTGRRSGWAAAHRGRAVLESRAGALDAAIGHIGASVQLWAELGMPFERARSLIVAGGIHRRRRQKAAATSVIREARATFDELGAPDWADRAADELDRLGDRRRAEARGDEMTGAEVRVAHLVAAGLQNRQVAAELFMSAKTVEAHLTRIYRKLGVRSRTELGAVLARRARLDREDGAGPAD